MSSASEFAYILRRSFSRLLLNDPLRLGASTAFFTLFALPPILFILSTAFSAIFRGAIERGALFKHLSTLIGKNTAFDVQVILENISGISSEPLIIFLGSVFLLFVSTTLFIVIQNSLQQVWHIRNRLNFSFKDILIDRFVCLALILLSGLLFIFGLLSDFALAYLERLLRNFDHEISVAWLRVLNSFVSMLLFSLWFAILYRYLPHARISWKAIRPGALLTGFLFSLGTYIIRILLVNSNFDTIYGTAGSVVILLLFVFYSSFILYFGASFIYTFALHHNLEIELKPFATRYRLINIE